MKLLLENWREYLTESKLRVFDFDDTIAKSDSNIHITTDTGERLEMTPGEYATHEMNPDYEYDFSEFEKQIDDAIVNSKVVNKLKDSLSRPEVKTTILTARSIGHPVTKYLKSIGLDAYVVPLGLQVGGKVTGQDKANWIEKHINKGYKTILLI